MVYFVPPDNNDSLTRLVLDGKEYTFKFSYNYYGEFWTMGIYGNNSTPIVSETKIVPMYPLFHFFRMVELPNGVICAHTSLERIGREDFTNNKARLVYISNAELEAYAEGLNG